MNVIFRVDSSLEMGTGHVMRCMVLADELDHEGHNVTFICRELPGNLIFLLKEKHFTVFSLPYSQASRHEISNLNEHRKWLGEKIEIELQQILSYLSKLNKIDWLVVDHYALDNTWQIPCRAYADKIMVIDDLADRNHDCDILLDQNYYSNPTNRYTMRVSNDCKQLIGPNFALLRPEFRETRQSLSNRDGKLQRIMVSLGGNDSHNVTRKIIDGIKASNYSNLPVDIVLGQTSPHKEEIQRLVKKHKNYYFHSPAKNMAELMKNADLAIGAGGTSTWERCTLGLPTLVVNMANNQTQLINEGLKANIFDYLGDISSLDPNQIAKKLNDIASNAKKLQDMSKNGMQLVDGLGVKRVIEAMRTYG